ncbi:MAG TPA: metallophosphoesterase [Solirubrobacteraceae bacterium]|nr:metallophosphoesterase [Solirubrobacteraceae bacterium]
MTRRAAALLAAALALPAAGCGIEERAPETPGSTLRATIADPDGDGELGRGPGEPLVDRTELAPRGRATREVARIGHLTDTHVRDEESPARVPFLDRLGPPITSTFRPQEAVSPQVLTAAVRSLNEERPQAVLVTGDLIDNAQRNELDQLLAVLGGGPVDPNSGGQGYRGVQAASNPDGFFYRPAVDEPRHTGVLNRAQERFFSPGLRAPWYAALGNHDLLVQGELPPTPETAAIAVGGRALLTFAPELRDRLHDLPRGGAPSPDLRDVPLAAIRRLIAEGLPGRRTPVPADPRRRPVGPEEIIDLLREAGTPAGAAGRLDYAVDVGRGLRVVVLDTVDREGGAGGVVTAEQLRFLRRALRRAGDRAIVVADHHGLERSEGGEAALRLLDEDPRVVAELSGDTHRHAIRARRTPLGGFWQISTGSLADWPQQGRMVRLVSGADGSRALETWVVDHAGATDGGDLAGFGRELAFLDAQGGRPQRFAGGRGDRNARLWLPNR